MCLCVCVSVYLLWLLTDARVCVTQVITEEIAATFEREHYVVLKNVLTLQEVEAANADVSQQRSRNN